MRTPEPPLLRLDQTEPRPSRSPPTRAPLFPSFPHLAATRLVGAHATLSAPLGLPMLTLAPPRPSAAQHAPPRPPGFPRLSRRPSRPGRPARLRCVSGFLLECARCVRVCYRTGVRSSSLLLARRGGSLTSCNAAHRTCGGCDTAASGARCRGEFVSCFSRCSFWLDPQLP